VEQVVRTVLLVAIPVLLLGVTAWLWLVVRPRQRRAWREHPELKPYGRRYLLRVSPLLAFAVLLLVLGGMRQDWLQAGIGGFCLFGFSWEVRKRWHAPQGR
jgi:hypothetical protein